MDDFAMGDPLSAIMSSFFMEDLEQQQQQHQQIAGLQFGKDT